MILTVSVQAVFAQRGMVEVVHLKNGSVIRGTVIEEVPNKSVKIQTADGSVFVYRMNEIEKLTKEPVRRRGRLSRNREEIAPAIPAAPVRAGRPCGLMQFTGVGFQELIASSGMVYSEMTFAYGYRFHDLLFAGGGTGVEFSGGDFRDGFNIRAPLFATAKINMNRKRVSPYFQLDAGYRLTGNDYFENGWFMLPKFGIDFNLGARRRTALFLSLTLAEFGKLPNHSSASYSDYYEYETYLRTGLHFGLRF
jgi:hypothetical protein